MDTASEGTQDLVDTATFLFNKDLEGYSCCIRPTQVTNQGQAQIEEEDLTTGPWELDPQIANALSASLKAGSVRSVIVDLSGPVGGLEHFGPGSGCALWKACSEAAGPPLVIERDVNNHPEDFAYGLQSPKEKDQSVSKPSHTRPVFFGYLKHSDDLLDPLSLTKTFAYDQWDCKTPVRFTFIKQEERADPRSTEVTSGVHALQGMNETDIEDAKIRDDLLNSLLGSVCCQEEKSADQIYEYDPVFAEKEEIFIQYLTEYFDIMSYDEFKKTKEAKILFDHLRNVEDLYEY